MKGLFYIVKGEARAMDIEDLIRSAKKGDRQSLHELIERHIAIVERFAFQIGVPSNDVEDVTQEVFLRVYRFLNQYSGKTFTTWLYKITLNVARDHFKKLKRQNVKERMAIEHAQPINHIDSTMFKREEDVYLHELIQQLDEKYKWPLVLFYFHDKKINEIAKILSLPSATVNTRLARARAILKQELQTMGGGIDAAR